MVRPMISNQAIREVKVKVGDSRGEEGVLLQEAAEPSRTL